MILINQIIMYSEEDYIFDYKISSFGNIKVWGEGPTYALSLEGSGISLGISVAPIFTPIFYYMERVCWGCYPCP